MSLVDELVKGREAGADQRQLRSGLPCVASSLQVAAGVRGWMFCFL
jgi:hypothetical protein